MQMLRKFGIEGGAKYIMMEYLKWFPILGTVMWLFDYLFIAQKLKLDKDKITENVKRYLKYYKDLGLSFLIFPEGTLNTPNNRITSRAYAKKVGLKEDPKYVILPKSTGIFMIADNLQPHINTLFDITIGYGGLTAQAIPYEEYLIENVFFSKRYPKEVHISVKRFQIDTLPGFDGKITAKNMPQVQATESEASVFDPLTNARKNAFNSWMRARFMEKDQELDYFYKNKRFPGETVATSEFSPNFSDFVIIAILWSTLWITIPLHVGVVKNAVSLLFGILK
jgi:lysocardiolipin and lysophospholipid acyltransferase